jgi:hypothetical protein
VSRNPVKKRTSTPLRMRRKPGRPAWEPTEDERRMIRACIASGGFTYEQIAAALRVDKETMVKHCKDDLEAGKSVVNATIDATLAGKAMNGDLGAIVWWDKTRRGYRDTVRNELTGADGGPIDSRSVVVEITPDMTPQQAAEAYRKLLG